ARLPHQPLHFSYGFAEAGEHRARDDGVPDVELGYTLHGGNRLHVVVVEAVTRVHLEAERPPLLHGADDATELLAAARLVGRIGIMPRVDLDRRGTRSRRRLYLSGIRIDEERHAHTGV